MRRGFLLAVLGLGAFVLFAVILLSPRGGQTFRAPPGATDSGDEPQLSQARAPRATNFAQPPGLPPNRSLLIARTNAKAFRTEESLLNGEDEQRDAGIAARIAQLEELSTKADRASLETLLPAIKNPNQEIRQAALDAISQSGNRAALPGLREAAAQTEDSREKQAIVDVIEYLSLPTLTELLSGTGATNNHRR